MVVKVDVSVLIVSYRLLMKKMYWFNSKILKYYGCFKKKALIVLI